MSSQFSHSIRILIVDDHEVVCEGLRIFLSSQPDLEVIGECHDGSSGLEAALNLQPDVVIMDVGMPNMDGTEATREFNRTSPGIKVIAFTAYDAAHYVRSMLSAGALAIVLKGSPLSSLLTAIRGTSLDNVYLDPAIASSVIQGLGEPLTDLSLKEPLLSKREEEVLRLIAEGYSNKEVAARLDVSVKTIETYKMRCLKKLSLRSRVDIMRYATDQGWYRRQERQVSLLS